MPPRLVNHVNPSDLREIEGYLQAHNLGINKYRVKVNPDHGVSQTLGIVSRRCLPPDISRCTWAHPRLYKYLMEFAAKYVSVPFTSIQVNDNYTCAPHKDVNNIGESYIVAFGNYTGGTLCVEDFDYNIHYRGLLFDGSQLLHWTKPWIGHRYSIVFHSLEPKDRWLNHVPSLSEYEVIEHEGRWKIRRISDGALFWGKQGLPHPLKGRRVNQMLQESPGLEI